MPREEVKPKDVFLGWGDNVLKWELLLTEMKTHGAGYLRKLRGKRTVREIASKAGLGHSYWTAIENGHSEMTPNVVKKLAEMIREEERSKGRY